jgi:SAM-dependent methyltransferase
MSTGPNAPAVRSTGSVHLDLFLISLLILFLELACIRWFPAHVLFLTFFTNTVLLACFLGMSVGCLSAGSKRDFLTWTPALLGLALAGAFGVETLMASGGEKFMDVGQQASPQMVYFGTEYNTGDLAQFRIPVELVNGFFFLVIALGFVGPGQLLGRTLAQVPDRVQAYTVNILGSVAGIALFAGISALHLSPFWWFLPAAIGLAWFLVPWPQRGQPMLAWASRPLLLAVIPLLAAWHTSLAGPGAAGDETARRQSFWSPYYRVDYDPAPQSIWVNLIGHQQMSGRTAEASPAHAYALPHALNRDAGGAPFENVLVIGAGSGNDVSRALQWGAKHVDAVEIDPVIYELGKRHHPDHPYDDPRVTVHLDDGRNFLRSTQRKYDLVIYALVDSLVLHSSYSNIRLESYLFTRQAFADVQRCLAPDGLFVMYNFYRQGWIVARLQSGLAEVFGGEPLVLGLPYRPEIGVGDNLSHNFTAFFAGNTAKLREAFDRHPEYWLQNIPPDPALTPSGFAAAPPAGAESSWTRFGLAKVVQPAEPLCATTDNWPFLYLRAPMLPFLTVRGMLLMGAVALGLLWYFRPRATEGNSAAAETGANMPGLNARMFFLGAGFMLVETKAVVHMALLFGSTWVVNSIVFFAVLVMILAANLFVRVCRPKNLAPYYVGLLAALALNVLVPLDFFLGMDRLPQVGLSCLLVFAPILFAGVIFAVSFARTEQPDRAFGFNVAGAMAGGLAENASMLVGFQYLILIAAAFYTLSLVASLSRSTWLQSVRDLTPKRPAEPKLPQGLSPKGAR